jgi:hypothetical protein
MWHGFDPQIRRELDNLKQMFRLTSQTPEHEWPLLFEDELDKLLVIREWPDGSVTAYLSSDYSDSFRNN